ncbi:MAG: PD-(D/E)XK nuclease family protein [Chthoniobacteraceae bacterium]
MTFLDEIGAQPELPLLTAIQQQVVRYFRRGCDVEELCGLGALLEQREEPRWHEYSEAAVRQWSERAFEKVQSRNARLLARAVPQNPVAQLVGKLGAWEAKVTWAEARDNWQRAIEALETGSQPLEPLWLRMEGLEVKGRFAADLFLRALESLLAGGKSLRTANHRYARVVLTTFRSAAEQSWDRVLLLDSQEGGWPSVPEENPFFNDAARQRWNERLPVGRPPLLTSLNRAALEQSKIANLIAQARGGLTFSACAVLPDGTEAHPNEWLMRLLALRGQPLQEWRRAICRVSQREETDARFAALAEIHRGRRDAETAFDEYSFHLGKSEEVEPWPVTGLDTARVLPATFAVHYGLGLESPAVFQRSEPQVIGQLAHRWLGYALGGGGWQRAEMGAEPAGRLDQAVRETAAITAEWFRGEGLEVPLWWRSLLQKAQWLARRCLGRVELGDAGWLVAEHSLTQPITTPAGLLRLKGRLDLVLSDREETVGAHWHIFDFKTGRTAPPTLAKVERGDGLQFAAYRLMAREAGAVRAAVGMIRQDAIFAELFAGEDDEALRAAMAFAARMQTTGCYGQLGPLRSERGGHEVLPMATTPIEPEILARKWQETWGGDPS